jgi:hypothetical protein
MGGLTALTYVVNLRRCEECVSVLLCTVLGFIEGVN